MKRGIMTLFLFIFFFAAWSGRYTSIELSAVHPQTVQIEIRGAVKNPGIYSLAYGSDVQDAVDTAGGLLENADISALSMIRQLKEGDLVNIAVKKEEEILLVSLNTASLEELCQLSGIGPVIAQRIIEYRDEHSFTAIEQIMEVKGIGEKMFEKIREQICL